MDTFSVEVNNVCSHQPSFLPWIGFWNKLSKVDTFIAMGGVDFNWRDYQNRVMVGGSLLTLSVDNKTKHGPLKDVEVIPQTLRDAATRIERQFCIKRYKHRDRVAEIVYFLEGGHEDHRLMSLNLRLQIIVSEILGLKYKLIVDNQTPDPLKDKHSRLLDCVRRSVQNPVYWAGPGAVEGYIDSYNMPFPFMAQKINPGVYSGSILQILAEESDPLTCIRNAATWYKLDKPKQV